MAFLGCGDIGVKVPVVPKAKAVRKWAKQCISSYLTVDISGIVILQFAVPFQLL